MVIIIQARCVEDNDSAIYEIELGEAIQVDNDGRNICRTCRESFSDLNPLVLFRGSKKVIDELFDMTKVSSKIEAQNI
jgi:hypothetical protein